MRVGERRGWGLVGIEGKGAGGAELSRARLHENEREPTLASSFSNFACPGDGVIATVP